MNKHDEGISKEEYWQTYVVWNSVFILIQSIIFISLLFRILKYRKDRYIDMFKLIQYVTAFICLAVSFSSKLFELIFVEKAMFFSKLYRLNDTNLINFQIISQFCWLTMIVHITSYERMKNIIFYGYAKKRIKIYEITIVILFLTHFLLTNACYIAISVIQSFDDCLYRDSKSKKLAFRDSNPRCSFSQSLEKDFMIPHHHFVSYFIMLSEIVLFIWLIVLLKRNLNYFFKKNIKALIQMSRRTMKKNLIKCRLVTPVDF